MMLEMCLCVFFLTLPVVTCNNQIYTESGKTVDTLPRTSENNGAAIRSASTQCHLVVREYCAMYFRNMVDDMNFNFAQLTLNFTGDYTVNQTSDAIMPTQWVWTYFIRHGIVPYLKWPKDFKVLSFSLLDTKTLSISNNFNFDIDVKGNNCNLELGSSKTTQLIGYAFGNLTRNYLYDKSHKELGYSYWCYLKQIPHVKQTMAYKFGIHFGFPIEFTRFNCCKTHLNLNRSEMIVECVNQVHRIPQIIYTPFILSLIAFAYFPILLLNLLGTTVSRHYRNGIYTGFRGVYTSINDVNIDEDNNEDQENDHQDWVYLDGRPPITFTSLFCGVCGMADKYPVCVSRCRRLLIIAVIPCVLYLEIYTYWKYAYETVTAYLEHGAPLAYLSVIGGLRRSMSLFAPYFGGPPCLIILYHVSSFIFLLIPRDLNNIMHIGSTLNSGKGHISALYVGDTAFMKLSGVNLNEYYGYFKAVAVCKASIYILVNYRFWTHAISIQITRIQKLYKFVCKSENLVVKVVFYVACCFCLPVYVIVCLLELVLCIVMYGLPIISALCIFAKGFANDAIQILEQPNRTGVTRLASVPVRQLLKLFLKILLFCLFVYWVFSISSIIFQSFLCIFSHIIMILIAVLTYPVNAFGYIFFFVILVYYVFKQLEYFGDAYLDLLSITIEISINMEENMCHARLENDVVIINKTQGFTISKLRVEDQIINLSTDQRIQIQNTRSEIKQRVKRRKDVVGIPRDLFQYLVKTLNPIHIQFFHTIIRLALITALVSMIISLVIVKPFGPTKDFGEVMHIIFLVVIGALPKILEIALEKSRHAIKDEIMRMKVKAAIYDFWTETVANNAYVVM